MDETTVVPGGMPAPERVWPVEIPVRLNTEVMDELPAVTIPKNVLMLVAVAAVDILIWLAPVTEMTVAPAGMPTPRVRASAVPLLAVAFVDITMLVPLDERTKVPDGMPAPEISWPFVTPLMLDTPVMVALPEVTRPVGATPRV